jgi:hypothetical protein
MLSQLKVTAEDANFANISLQLVSDGNVTFTVV